MILNGVCALQIGDVLSVRRLQIGNVHGVETAIDGVVQSVDLLRRVVLLLADRGVQRLEAAVYCRLDGVCLHSGIILLVANRAVQVRKAKADCIVYVADTVLEFLERKLGAEIGSCDCALSSGVVPVSSPAAVAPATEYEQEQDNNPKMLPYGLFIPYFYHFIFVIVRHIFSTAY